MHYSFRNKKMTLEVIQKSSGLSPQFQSEAGSSVSKGHMALDQSCGDRAAWSLGGGIVTPVGPEGRHQVKEDYS